MSEHKKTYAELEQELREARETNAALATNLMNVQAKCIQDMHDYIRALVWDCDRLWKMLKKYDPDYTAGFEAISAKKGREEADLRKLESAVNSPEDFTVDDSSKGHVESVKDYV